MVRLHKLRKSVEIRGGLNFFTLLLIEAPSQDDFDESSRKVFVGNGRMEISGKSHETFKALLNLKS